MQTSQNHTMKKNPLYHLTVRVTFGELYTDEHVATFTAKGDAYLGSSLFNENSPNTHTYFISPIKTVKP